MPGEAPLSPVRPPARGRWLFLLVPLLVLPVPFLVNRYIQYVLNLILVYVLVGVGFNIVIGNLGQLAFANVALFGLGAYASGILVVHAGWPWWTTIVPAGLIGALAGILASLPALRRIRLFYLAIMTMAFGELLRWIYIRAEPLTNGSMGLAVPPPMLLGLRLQSDRSKFYVFLVLVVVVVLLTSSLLRSRFGRAFMAIRDNELAAAAMGIPTVDVYGPGRSRHARGLQPPRADPPLRHRDGGGIGEPDRIGNRGHRPHHHAGALVLQPVSDGLFAEHGHRGAPRARPDHRSTAHRRQPAEPLPLEFNSRPDAVGHFDGEFL